MAQLTSKKVKNQKEVENIIREIHNDHNSSSHPEDRMSFLEFLDMISGTVIGGKYRVEIESCDFSFDGKRHVYYHV